MAVSAIIVTNISADRQQIASLRLFIERGESRDISSEIALADLVREQEIHGLLNQRLMTVTVKATDGATTYTNADDLVDFLHAEVADSQSSTNAPVTASLSLIADPSLEEDDVGKLLKLTPLNQAMVYQLSGGVADDHYLGKLLSLQGVQAIVENVPMTWLISGEPISRGQTVSGADNGRVRVIRGGDVALGKSLTTAVGAGEYILIRYV